MEALEDTIPRGIAKHLQLVTHQLGLLGRDMQLANYACAIARVGWPLAPKSQPPTRSGHVGSAMMAQSGA